jgi:hypothetical protein
MLVCEFALERHSSLFSNPCGSGVAGHDEADKAAQTKNLMGVLDDAV